MSLTAKEMTDYPQLVELRECPFCGGEAYIRTPTHMKGTAFDVMSIECIRCGASPFAINVYEGKTDEEKQSIIAEKWNKRWIH